MWFASLFVLTGLFIGQWQSGQCMVQNCKVVHSLVKRSETAELNAGFREEAILSLALAGSKAIFLQL